MLFDAESRQKHGDKRKGAMDLLGDYLASETNEIEEIWDAIRSQKEVSSSLIQKTDDLEKSVGGFTDSIEDMREKVEKTNADMAATRDGVELAMAEMDAVKEDVDNTLEEMKAAAAASGASSASALALATEAKNGMDGVRADLVSTRSEIIDNTERKIDELRDVILEQKNTIDKQAAVIEEVTKTNEELKKKLLRDNIIAIIISAAALGVTLCVLAYFMSMH